MVVFERITLHDEEILKYKDYKAIRNINYPEYGYRLIHKNEILFEGILSEDSVELAITQLEFNDDPRITHKDLSGLNTTH